jgi:two-component sensor histidine kinase
VVHEVKLEAERSEQFDRQDNIKAMNMNFLTIFANHAAIALQNAQLYSDLRFSEQKLQETLKQVVASLEEKKVLLSEIHHRVKNNLQIISSLLSLQTKYIKDENHREIFKDSQNRIRVMSSIHEKLYQSEDLAKIDFDHYIKDLASSLFRTYAIIDRIALKTEIENVSLSINFAIPCGLILNELISNSLKYAFPEDNKGEIKVTLRCVEDKVELLVSDNGIGMPEDLDFRNTESLGLQLVTNIVENQLHGQIKLNRTGGTEFQINFKAAE